MSNIQKVKKDIIAIFSDFAQIMLLTEESQIYFLKFIFTLTLNNKNRIILKNRGVNFGYYKEISKQEIKEILDELVKSGDLLYYGRYITEKYECYFNKEKVAPEKVTDSKNYLLNKLECFKKGICNLENSKKYNLNDFNILTSKADISLPKTLAHGGILKTKFGPLTVMSNEEKNTINNILKSYGEHIVDLKTQCVKIPYHFKKRTKNYIPDLMFLTSGGKIVIIEIKKTYDMANNDTLRKMVALEKYCIDNGYICAIINSTFDTLRDIKNKYVYPEISTYIEACFKKQKTIEYKDIHSFEIKQDIKGEKLKEQIAVYAIQKNYKMNKAFEKPKTWKLYK